MGYLNRNLGIPKSIEQRLQIQRESGFHPESLDSAKRQIKCESRRELFWNHTESQKLNVSLGIQRRCALLEQGHKWRDPMDKGCGTRKGWWESSGWWQRTDLGHQQSWGPREQAVQTGTRDSRGPSACALCVGVCACGGLQYWYF